MKPALILLAFSLLLTGCGVKNDLTKPNGETTSRDTHDPSRPPGQLGR